MRSFEKILKTSIMTVFQKIINGYPSVVEPESNELLRIGVVLFTLARISTFYHVKIRDGRTIDCFSNIYFLFFGGSGEGKGKIARSFEQLDSFKSFLDTEKKQIKRFEEDSLRIVSEQYLAKYSVQKVFKNEFTQENPKDDQSERKKAITYARSKIKNIQPIMIEATRPSIESTAIAINLQNKMSVSIRNDEFLIWIKRKQNESFELFEFMAEVYDNGEAVTKSTNMANRSVEEATISNFPLNAMFMSSESLMSDNGVSGVLRDFFITAGARRFLTGAGEELNKPMYDEEELNGIYESKKNETDIYIGRFIESCSSYNEIIIDPELRKYISNDKKEIKKKVKEMKLSELSKIEIRGSTWRSTKIAGLLAFLNHPDSNVMTLEDYLEAKKISNLFINSFRGIVEKNWSEGETMIIDYIKKNPGCSKGNIYSLSVFSKNKNSRKKQYADSIDVIMETIRNEGEELIIKTGEDGKTLEHYIAKIPQAIEEDGEFMFCVSASLELAKNYKPLILTPGRMMDLMNNKKKIKYCFASLKDDYRSGEHWEGGNNCLAVDIDNDDKELKIEQSQKIFEDYTYIIQPTKSHQIKKGTKGVRDRYRILFPTSPMPLDKKVFRDVITNFHSFFGITEFGDIGASGDPVRYWEASLHKALYHKGKKRINWEMFNEVKKTYSRSYEASDIIPKNVEPSLSSFFGSYCGLIRGEKKRVKCPMHEDKKPSAFVARHKDSGNLYLSCSACNKTWFEK